MESRTSFSTNIPVSWFNFIVHLLTSPDKFAWTVTILKSGMWELFTAMENMDQAFMFHIPDKCPTSHAPICQAMKDEVKDKENIGVSANRQDVESQALLQPFGQDNLRKKRNGKTPLVETKVRGSDRIKKHNAGYKRNSCSNNNCLLGNVAENKKFPTVSPRSIYEFI